MIVLIQPAPKRKRSLPSPNPFICRQHNGVFCRRPSAALALYGPSPPSARGPVREPIPNMPTSTLLGGVVVRARSGKMPPTSTACCPPGGVCTRAAPRPSTSRLAEPSSSTL
uniref:Uncharacterized protein n=1 Tax=Prymnesium polylepis TaxID=72548 RepID=A0A7S4HRP4_9EUKA